MVAEFFSEFEAEFVSRECRIHDAQRLHDEFPAFFVDLQGKGRYLSRQHSGLQDQPVRLRKQRLSCLPYLVGTRLEFETFVFGHASQQRRLFGVGICAELNVKVESTRGATKLQALRT